MAKKILVVDDDPDLLHILETRFKAAGYQTVTASSGRDAFEKAQKETPDLIVLDIVMPGIDGFQTLTQLKSSPKTSEIPVIILTARGQTDDADEAMKLGATAYMTKPFESKELLAKIQEVLDTYRR